MDSVAPLAAVDPARLRRLQRVGVACGFAAGAWLGAAEAPTKVVTLGIPPVVISLAMVLGVFLARWTIPAMLRGTSGVGADVRQAPHLVVWAVLAGCLWAVANTLTIFAIKDIGLSIAFPLWNSNSLIGIVWGLVFFNELRQAGWSRWLGVLGGAALMFGGATLLAVASSAHAPPGHPLRGVAAALAAGVLWGTMYIPYRKAYLTGMNPLSFVTFFTVGELGMMFVLAVTDRGGVAALAADLHRARDVLFWLLLGGFVWVVGDLFQQYAAKYVVAAHGGGRRRYRARVGHGTRAPAVAGSGDARERPLRRGPGVRPRGARGRKHGHRACADVARLGARPRSHRGLRRRRPGRARPRADARRGAARRPGPRHARAARRQRIPVVADHAVQLTARRASIGARMMGLRSIDDHGRRAPIDPGAPPRGQPRWS